jgi:hypothetical protein
MNVEAAPPVARRRGAVTRIGVVAVAVVLVVLALSGVAERRGAAQVEAGFQRALVAFALARALNGVISVVQGTEVAVQPAGVGVNLAPGQILDPVNDLVERFSWVMLASTTSFGIQRLLLEILAWPGVSVLLVLLAVLLVIAVWRREGWLARRRGWLLRVGLFVAVVRFLVPALAISGEAIHGVFVEPRYAAAVAGLEEAVVRLGELSGETSADDEAEESSLVDRLKSWYAETGAALDIEARLREYRVLAGRAIEQTIDLIVIFTFQTILLPFAFVWFVALAYRTMVRAWRESARS